MIDQSTTPSFHIYRSSAGSGKTYTLTREFLVLALQDPESFRGILAVTFTNKATQEMKDRILETLHELSTGKSSMAAELRERTGLGEELLAARAEQVLQSILHHYTWFSISTIDSFFQKIIRAFAREVGIQGAFKVELDQTRVLQEVIDELLLELGHNKELASWVLRFSEEKVEESRHWDVRQDMYQLATELLQERVRLLTTDLKANSEDKGFIKDFQRKLQKEVKQYEVAMQGISRKAEAIKKQYGLETKDFAYGANGVAGYLLRIDQPEDKAKYEPGSRVLAALEDPDKWASKSSKLKEPIAQAVAGGLQDCLQEVITLFARGHRLYESARQVLRNLYTYGILSDIARKLKAYKEENDLMLISDSTQFLHGIIGDNDAPFIYEKTGSRYQHYLIDEFQDTSQMQWQNFKPLLENSLAEGRLNLVVGDVKQSIYRWRGGDLELLLEGVEQAFRPDMTSISNLATNWRSREQVIAFNNSLFAGAADLLQRTFAEELDHIEDEALRDWLQAQTGQFVKAYEDVAQLFPQAQKTDEPEGYVTVSLLAPPEEDPKETNERWRERVLEELPALLEQAQDRGYQLRDMAVLVRRKGEGRLIADYLMAYQAGPRAKPGYRYDVVSNESLYLGQAPVIKLLIHGLRYLVNPADGIARVGLALEWHRYLKQAAPPLASLFHEVAAEVVDEEGNMQTDWFPEELVRRRPWLSKQPLFEVIENLIALFELEAQEETFAYLQAFQDLILEYIQQENTDLISFLEWWDETGKTQSIKIPEAMNAMRIMTIHKSKGLQFPLVLVPFCNWNFDHESNQSNILWTRSAEPLFAEAGYLPIRYTAQLRNTVFRADYYQERMRAAMDNLNLLYVALTRAEEELHIYGRKPGKPGGMVKDASALLDRCLEAGTPTEAAADLPGVALAEQYDPETGYFSLGDMTKRVDQKAPGEHSRLQSYAARNWRSKLSIRPKSANFFKETDNAVADQVNYGNLLHELLASINYLEEVDEKIALFRFEGKLDEHDEPRVRALLAQMMEQSAIADWFSENWEVKTEVPILPRTGELRRPDRVLIGAGRCLVIDFKLGKARNSHIKQVKEYMQLLSQMGYPKVEGYLLYLDDLTISPVI